MASRVEVGQIWASTHRGDRDAGVRQHREVVAVDAAHAELQTMPGGRRARVRLRVGGDRTTILNHRLVSAPASSSPPAKHDAADGLQTDELLARIHERLGSLGLDISTFGETGQIEVRWKRDYSGIWSDERFLIADRLSDALRGVLDREDQADREDAEACASERDAD